MKKKKREPFVDDGRVIANMNVEGMPWYKGVPDTSDTSTAKEQIPIEQIPIELTAKEKRAMMRGVMSAAFLVTFIFVAVFALFIGFCVFVWFK